MGFYSYAIYKKCFDWAYSTSVLSTGGCTSFIENDDNRIFVTFDNKIFCVKPE